MTSHRLLSSSCSSPRLCLLSHKTSLHHRCSTLQRRHCLIFFSATYVSSFLVLALDRSTSLTAQSFLDALEPKNKENDMRDKQAQMTLARQRTLILAYGDMETACKVHIYSSYEAIPLKTLENSSLILMQCAWCLLTHF